MLSLPSFGEDFVCNDGEIEENIICRYEERGYYFNSIEEEIAKNTKFWLKWRITKDSFSDEISDLKGIDTKLKRAAEILEELAEIKCSFEELYPGGKIHSGSHAQMKQECINDFRLGEQHKITESAYSYSHVKKPSFDCSLSMTNVEKTICSDANLSVEDVTLSNYYKILPKNGITKEMHKTWMLQKRNACETKPRIKDCLKNVMSERSSFYYEKLQ